MFSSYHYVLNFDLNWSPPLSVPLNSIRQCHAPGWHYWLFGLWIVFFCNMLQLLGSFFFFFLLGLWVFLLSVWFDYLPLKCVFLGAGETVKWVAILLCKWEDPSADFKHLQENQEIVVSIQNPSTGAIETGILGDLPASQHRRNDGFQDQWQTMFKKYTGHGRGRHQPLASTCPCIGIYIYAHMHMSHICIYHTHLHKHTPLCTYKDHTYLYIAQYTYKNIQSHTHAHNTHADKPVHATHAQTYTHVPHTFTQHTYTHTETLSTYVHTTFIYLQIHSKRFWLNVKTMCFKMERKLNNLKINQHGHVFKLCGRGIFAASGWD